ncbi:hypothetical protein LTR86_001577 [Recurvomyces mirabilis]|nr:hypothetical protein LTR86_001577 [Recurvomyces mirabilis]
MANTAEQQPAISPTDQPLRSGTTEPFPDFESADQPPVTRTPEEPPMPKVKDWAVAPTGSHSRTDEIIRQVEYYFSDENLPHDAYLLGFAGMQGTNPVSISLITGFKKMKQYRPNSAVREALRCSTVVEVIDNKHIKRRAPLTIRPTVTPRIDINRYKKQLQAAQQPHMTAGMLKPTGFEPYATEGPISPAQYEKNLEKYGPEEGIIARMETAVNSFSDSRKMHQHTRRVFEKFVLFGGFSTNNRMFQGGMNKKQAKAAGLAGEEVQTTEYYGIVEQISDAFYAEEDGSKKSNWVVDFEGIAKAFLSSQFLQHFEWTEAKQVATTCMVLRNFYNYLMAHSACPEYHDQLLAARVVCDAAEIELPKLAIVDRSLPGAFNSACSTLLGGSWANARRAKDSWANDGDNIGLERGQADIIVKAGVAAHGSDEQLKSVNDGMSRVSTERGGLEIVGVQLADEKTKQFYADLGGRERYEDFIHCMGKLICKRWAVPFAAPVDVPASAKVKPNKDETFTFLVEDETLKFCEAGMKMAATVIEMNNGIKFIDSIEMMFPTFYEFLPNERIFEWKEPGPPKAWMARQTVNKDGGEGADARIEQGEANGGGGGDGETLSDEEHAW